MENLQEKIKQILKSWIKSNGCINTEMEAVNVSEEITTLIEENYIEKEFVEWYIIDVIQDSDGDNTWFQVDDITVAYTLDELHDYWLKEVKDK